MKKYVNGKLVNMTAQEITQRQTEQAAHEAAKPMNDWVQIMMKTDIVMPRHLEDVIDVLTSDQRAALAPETLEKYNEKKDKRALKPNAD